MDVKPEGLQKLDALRAEFHSLLEAADETLVELDPNVQTAVDSLREAILIGHQIQQIELAIVLASVRELRATLDKIAASN
jgi:hypothetical protein